MSWGKYAFYRLLLCLPLTGPELRHSGFKSGHEPKCLPWQRKLNAGNNSSMLVSEFLCFHAALNVFITLHAMLNLNVILIPCT